IYEAIGQKEQAAKYLQEMLELNNGNAQNLMEYALDYAAAGLYLEASQLLEYAIGEETSPMVYYYLAFFAAKLNDATKATDLFSKAAKASSYLCFPNRLVDISILQFAIAHNPSDAKAPYYLGNLWYDKRQYSEAIACWEQSIAVDKNFPTVHRNLGIAYFNKTQDRDRAIGEFELAFSLDKKDARVLMELDQLYKRINRTPNDRLNFLERHLETVLQRDDVYLERLSLSNFSGDYTKAYDLLMKRKFHPWEGGEGRVSGQYIFSLVEWAKQELLSGNYELAIELLTKAQTYPHNLGEGKLYGAAENDIFYWMGIAHEKLGNSLEAKTKSSRI
ncbi:MAG: tetratricopeptide repeat protein, partial [Pedobacter sp.]